MTASATAVNEVLDAPALEWLDQLLQATDAERNATLERLAREQPELFARVSRLLAVCEHSPTSMLLQRHARADWTSPRVHAGLHAGLRLAGYRLIRELGRGGMAVVWLAERDDGLIKREVALKMPLFSIDSAVERERFTRERDVLATLSHPRIAQLFDAGVTETGQPFIVLEQVQGQSLLAHCDAQRLGLRDRLRLFLQVLEAVAHAHKHLVVHRDIKPSNILVDAQGQVKLLDFGVAKLLADPASATLNSELTQAAGCALTPRYAAPEQLDNGPISTATDVYALGVLLHELLVGQSPYGAGRASVAQWIDAVRHVEPLRPSQQTLGPQALAARCASSASSWQAALAGDLDTIVQTALRKPAGERYGSVERLADDVQRYLGHRPISARPPSLLHRCRLLWRRHRLAPAAVAVGLAGITVSATLAWHAHQDALAHDQRASAVRDFMFDLVDDAEPDEAHPDADVTGRQMLAGAVARARERFAAQPRLQGELLGELARMQDRLGDTEGAARVVDEANALLEAHAPADDPALNRTRMQQANLAFDQDALPRAGQLAQQAFSSCTNASADCAKVRAYARELQSKLALRDGDAAAAVQLMHDNVQQSALGFGAAHVETALAWHALAVMARNTGDLKTARDALGHAQTIAAGTQLRAADRTTLTRTQALLLLDAGQFEPARVVLAALVQQTRDPDEQAIQHRLMAQSLLEQGRPDEALAEAEAAVGPATPGRATPELLFARQARARALGLTGQHPAALREMDAVLAGLSAAGYPPSSREWLRARRFRAELQARAGQLDEAEQALRAVLAEAPGPFALGLLQERGQALALRASIARLRGHPADAVTWNEQAASLLQAQLPADHPWLTRLALEWALSRWMAAPTPAHRQELEDQAGRAATSLPDATAWRAAITSCLADPAAGRSCTVLL